MRKKTAVHATKRQADSPTKKSGLIAKGKNSPQSAMTESVLDNRSHRTTLGISCVRLLTSCKKRSVIYHSAVRSYQLLPPRMSASCACYTARLCATLGLRRKI
jgi:hypothetical protein